MASVAYVHEEHCPASNDFHKTRVPCRYYQSGNCRRGPGCPFLHIPVADQADTLATPHPAYQAERMYTAYLPLGQTPVYRPLTSPAYPVFLWQPYTPLSPSFDPRYGLARQAETLADYPDDRSDPSSVESSSTGTSIDYHLRMPLDPAWLDGVESGPVRGTASPPGDVKTNSSPGHPAYGHPFFPGIKPEHASEQKSATSGQHHDHGSAAAQPSSFLLPRQDDIRKKPLAYKTKPCKFYTENGKCASGEKCTFIHDPGSKGEANKSPVELAPPLDAKLPPKPLNKYDDCRARDFYPITWRVIGGGVMMGGQRQICPAYSAGNCKYGIDCKLAHETELETDHVGFIDLKNEESSQQPGNGGTSKRIRSSSQKGKPKTPPTETQPPVEFPSVSPRPHRPPALVLGGVKSTRNRDDDAVASCLRGGPTSPVHRRTQSMSMVITSPPPLDTPHSSYAAEL